MRSVIISGGGTGGHIYPALAIADEIKRRHPNCIIRFVGAEGRMEMEKIPEAGYPIDGLPISGIERKVFSKKNLLFPLRLAKSLSKAKKLIAAYRPDAVVGVGGFASGPLLRVAAAKSIPTLIQEQNSFPGITNRLLAKKATVICTGFPNMSRWFPEARTVHTGNPLRNSISNTAHSKAEALAAFNLHGSGKVIFIMGGSLGARTINEAVMASLKEWSNQDYQIIWQTGQRFVKEYEELLAQHPNSNVSIVGFIQRMDLAYSAADLIVSRAGAMSISELALVGKPTLFVPSPNVSEDHQTKNARTLTDHHAALLIPDASVSEQLGTTVTSLLNDPERCQHLSQTLKGFAKPDAAAAVVDQLEKIVLQ
jgi:UDP-N-acetylglucosamine--N-acetylmuramyl-(pentapeptide) pyrophosphoryl-undecaprenol N-acetylglucosamine transferase